MIPEERLYQDTPKIKIPQRYINKCKEAAWERWKRRVFAIPSRKTQYDA